MTLDTPDADLLDQTIGRIAADLKDLGDTDTVDVRRARAVGILADPQHALDLHVRPRAAAPPATAHGRCANLYVHLTPARPRRDLTATGAVRSRSSAPPPPSCSPTGSPATPHVGAKITLRPVLDLNYDRAVDQHDPPAAMRETRHPARRPLRVPRLPPRLPRPATSTTSPPTSHSTRAGHRARPTPANLAPLCRTHHRIKTHTAWDYKRLDGGGYTWTAPTGHQYDRHPVTNLHD